MNSNVTLIDLLKESAKWDHRGVTFIKSGKNEELVSYREVYTQALGILGYLQSVGIKPQEELVFQITDKNNELFIYLFWACILGGIIPVPVSVGSCDEHRNKLFRIWKVLNNPYLIVEQDILSGLEKYSEQEALTADYQEIYSRTITTSDIISTGLSGALVHAEPGNIGFIQFSSGSTGDPKGVMLTHEGLLTNINDINERLEVTAQDSSISWMPLTHDMGIIFCHMACLAAGINQYIMPTSLFIQRPTLWIDKASEHKITMLYSPNFGYKYLLTYFKKAVTNTWNLSRVRLIVNGAEPISVSLIKEFLDTLGPFGLQNDVMLPGYGLAEACVAVSIHKSNEAMRVVHINRDSLVLGGVVNEVDESNETVAFVEVGVPITNCQTGIFDDQGKPLGEGRFGHICIYGKNVTKGYYNNDEASRKLFLSNEWLNTGDIGFIRNGRLVITGRSKDIIFVNGQNYYPHDLERLAEELEEIELGRIVVCGAQNNEQENDDIIIFVLFKKQLNDFVPLCVKLKKTISEQTGLAIKDVLPIARIPKTTSGKVQRYQLAENYKNGEYKAVSEQLRSLLMLYNNEGSSKSNEMEITKLETELLSIWKKVLKVESVSIHDHFLEIGGNSLLLTQMHGYIEDLYPDKLSKVDIFSNSTIEKLAVHLAEKLMNDAPGEAMPYYMQFPGDYFSEIVYSPVPSQFDLSVGQYSNLKTLANHLQVTTVEVILAIYIYLLYEVTQQTDITVYGFRNRVNAYKVCINLSIINEFEQLVYSIKQCTGNIHPKALESSYAQRPHNSLIIGFYEYSDSNAHLYNQNYCDLLLGFSNKGSFNLLNSPKVKSEKARELFHQYLTIFDLLTIKNVEV
ncbi:non-ribosomal peptide synthetase [Paenibacillus sp. FSL R7-0345]|uniref:non-ribosomal peptide synthetase n=1 Tax=Paenibacillus sp. FSL R7-0345 TaxID=2954535 RepID=UPI00315AEE2E